MKRTFLLAACLLAGGVVAMGPGRSAAQTGASWSTFHGDMQRDGVSSTNGPTTGTAVNSWTLPKGVDSSVVVDASGIGYVGDNDGNVYALDPSSPAQPKWAFPAGGAGHVPVTGTGTLSPDGHTLYIGAQNGMLYAINTATGAQIWADALNPPLSASPAISPDGSTVYEVSANGELYGITASNGNIAWKSPIEGAVQGSLALSQDGSTLYAATSNEVMFSFAATGSKAGQAIAPYYLDSASISTPVIDQNGYIYITTTQGSLTAFAPSGASSGTPVWTFTVSNHAGAATAPAIAGLNVIYAAGDGSLYSINRQNGQPNWTDRSIGATRSSPVIAGSTVYVGSDNGNTYGIDLSTGKILWIKKVGEVAASPAVGPDGSIWVGSESDTVYRIHDLPPLQPPPTQSAAQATSTPAPTSTGVPATATPTTTTALTVALKSRVAAGRKQVLTIHTTPNAVVHLRVEYPNGDHQSHHLTTNSSGVGTYSYTQGSSKILHNRFYAKVTTKVGSGAGQLTLNRKYKILFGKIDVSVEPRTARVGQKVTIYVHTKASTRVVAEVLSPSGHFARITGTTGGKGWAQMRYKVAGNLRSGKNTRATVLARLRSGNPSYITKTSLTIK